MTSASGGLGNSGLLLAEDKPVLAAAVPILAIGTWYDTENCLNCRPDRITASGKVLDDDSEDCAYDGYPLGTKLTLKYQGKTAECLMTDRIGKEGRIDLLPKVFEKLEDLDKGVIELEIIKWK